MIVVNGFWSIMSFQSTSSDSEGLNIASLSGADITIIKPNGETEQHLVQGVVGLPTAHNYKEMEFRQCDPFGKYSSRQFDEGCLTLQFKFNTRTGILSVESQGPFALPVALQLLTVEIVNPETREKEQFQVKIDRRDPSLQFPPSGPFMAECSRFPKFLTSYEGYCKFTLNTSTGTLNAQFTKPSAPMPFADTEEVCEDECPTSLANSSNISCVPSTSLTDISKLMMKCKVCASEFQLSEQLVKDLDKNGCFACTSRSAEFY